MNNIANKTALITGGSKGIGYGIAESLLQQDMNVVITGRSQETISAAADQLNQIKPGKALGVAADVRQLADQEKAVQETLNAYGQLDLLIANAGVGHFASIEDMTLEQWHDTMDINLTGVFNSIKPAITPLKDTKGMIITVASLAGTNFFPRGAAYNASKFGLVGFTQAVMMDLRQHGIRVSTIMPGSVKSQFNHPDPNADESWKIQPEDLGSLVIELMQMNPRTLPSKIEVRPSMPPSK